MGDNNSALFVRGANKGVILCCARVRFAEFAIATADVIVLEIKIPPHLFIVVAEFHLTAPTTTTISAASLNRSS